MMSHVWMIPPKNHCCSDVGVFLSAWKKLSSADHIAMESSLSVPTFQGLLFLTGAFYVGNGWVAGGCWGLLGWLALVIMDHSLKFPAFRNSKFLEGHAGSAQISGPTQPFGAKNRIKDDRHTQYHHQKNIHQCRTCSNFSHLYIYVMYYIYIYIYICIFIDIYIYMLYSTYIEDCIISKSNNEVVYWI